MLTLDGQIRADGQSATTDYGGGGSGGAIWATVGTLRGSGHFQADGGDGTGGSYSCGGGGGRIAVEYLAAGEFNGFAASSAHGGTGSISAYNGHDGSVLFVDTSVLNHRLTIYQDLAWGPMTGTFASISLMNGAWGSLGEDSLLQVDETVLVDEGSILELGGGTTLRVDASLSVSHGSTVLARGKDIAGQVEGAWVGRGVTIEASNLLLDVTSVLSADAQGYAGGHLLPGQGPGAGAVASYAAGGAGYGGAGGAGTGTVSGGQPYGSARRPTHLGSSGGEGTSGYASTRGGNGGGALRLVVPGVFLLDGLVSAKGEDGSGDYCSGGAGGSIWIDAGELTGTGSLSADGGAAGTGAGGGGAGRIAVY